MTSDETSQENVDFVGAIWHGLDARTRNILELRLLGFTLDEIGQDLLVTRERVRQLEKKGRNLLKSAISLVLPTLAAELDRLADDVGAFNINSVQDTAETKCSHGIAAFLQSMGYQHCQVWGRRFPDWWVKDPTIVLSSLSALIEDAPFKGDEFADRCSSAKVPAGFPIEDALTAPGSGILQDKSGGWIRRSSKSADSAYLWLSERVEPAEAEEIAAEIGAVSARALSEVMRRNDARFTQIRPEGTWALREWSHLSGTTYRDATEAVIDVLQDLGPLTLPQLTAETIRRYPVTPWRVNQCIFSSDVGKTEDGTYDLIRRGATPILLQEPVKPEYMAESGNTVAVKLSVNAELLRGSGIGVNVWLTWKLGLHTYPSHLDFDGVTPVTVRRLSGGPSISSLRTFAQEFGLQEGCSLFVIFNTNVMVVELRHGCAAGCPNGLP
ncbi:sigma factor-like helix-turn-helix DNA-binding protein [Arthrobacter sp. A5]|uniref:sigma factor-like helix-turn-helix DNA-binding protein n=1 Tax=Arthrobacter sp. A5 TaxID=576926 RepID=UPI003DA83E9B